MRRIPRPVPLVALAVLSALLAPRVRALHGSLGSVEGSKQFVSARGILVAPVSRTDVPNLVDIGIVECEGFEHLVLNLAIEAQLPVEAGGAGGAGLTPDFFPYDRAFHPCSSSRSRPRSACRSRVARRSSRRSRSASRSDSRGTGF